MKYTATKIYLEEVRPPQRTSLLFNTKQEARAFCKKPSNLKLNKQGNIEWFYAVEEVK